MQKVNGLWLPNDNPNYRQTVGAKGIKSGYFWPEWYKRCLAHIPSRRVAIDVGAHVGGVTKYLAKHFAFVHAYEPWPYHVKCFQRNVTADNVELHVSAVGNHVGQVRLETGPNIPVRVSTNGSGLEVPITTLDAEQIGEVDFIKINLEGYDLAALKGAQKTIDLYHPAIFVEQHHIYKPSYYKFGDTEAVTFLEEMGAKLLWRQGQAHYFFVFP